MRKQKQWSLSQEEEDEYRRNLFTRAGSGDRQAKKELWDTYGVRVWSEQERARLVYENPMCAKKR